ncbi:ankyrin repeat domain-containing protein [Legionella jordanis]|nr:ankyrin repeat domain-containing protein [Legionella jordanis]
MVAGDAMFYQNLAYELSTMLEGLGYPKLGDYYCHGFAVRWLEAHLLGEEKQFDERIQYILLNRANFKDWLTELQSKKNDTLSQNDQQLLDALAFCESLMLFQAPFLNPGLFDRESLPTQQDLESISPLASCDKIQVLGGIREVYEESFLSNLDELELYLKQLEEAFTSHSEQLDKPLAVLLTGAKHSTALSFKPSIGWYYLDIETYPAQYLNFADRRLLAEKIMHSLKRDIHSPFVALNSAVLLTASDPRLNPIAHALAEVKNKHLINTEVAQRKDQVNLAYLLARRGDCEGLRRVADLGADLSLDDEEGRAPIHVAAAEGQKAIILELVTRGVDINQTSNCGATAVLLAAQSGFHDLVEELAVLGADLNKPLNNGNSPILAAALQGFSKVISKLAKHGADVDQTNSQDESAAYICALRGHKEALEELGTWGAKMSETLINGVAPIHAAAHQGHSDIIDYLATRVDVNQETQDGTTAVFIAAQKGFTQVIERLAIHKADLNKPKENGCTACFIAAQNGHFKAVQKLLEYGADPSLPTSFNRLKLLNFAMARGTGILNRMQTFIEQNSGHSEETVWMRPYDIAAVMGHHELAELLSEQPKQTLSSNKSRPISFFPPQQAEDSKDSPSPKTFPR